MKIFFLVLVFSISQASFCQNIDGSWELIQKNNKPLSGSSCIRIYEDGYFMESSKEGDYKFSDAKGGRYTVDASTYSEEYDFNTSEENLIHTSKKFKISTTNDTLQLKAGNQSSTWLRISSAKNKLSGLWVLKGNKENGKVTFDLPKNQTCLKIISGEKFQWVTFNPENGKFIACGAGSSYAQYDVYLENIEVFSRDEIMVGASLSFEYELDNGQWYHRGTSSEGKPLYEIWEPYRFKKSLRE
ncbi:hypothetical protein [Zunongwangia sp.]|uniref:hypothetical protein n=1 Tax=Zunongwangia sp. TaxID=1965325 RepID=UPI003AA7F4DA